MYLDDTPRCVVCGGSGVVGGEPVEAEAPDATTAEFVQAWVMVDKYGPADALALLGESAWDERFVEGLAVFEAELQDLEARGEAAWRRSSSKSL